MITAARLTRMFVAIMFGSVAVTAAVVAQPRVTTDSVEKVVTALRITGLRSGNFLSADQKCRLEIKNNEATAYFSLNSSWYQGSTFRIKSDGKLHAGWDTGWRGVFAPTVMYAPVRHCGKFFNRIVAVQADTVRVEISRITLW